MQNLVKRGEGILNPTSTWVNMNDLNRKSDLNLRWHMGKFSLWTGTEKREGTVSVPGESGQKK